MTDDQIAQLRPGQKIYTYVLDEDGAVVYETRFFVDLQADGYYLSKREALVAMRAEATEALKQAQRNLKAVQRMLDDVNSRED